jgi:DNA-binding MarR family transcriptional regulator
MKECDLWVFKMTDEQERMAPISDDAASNFTLSEFFPYQTRVFYRHISSAVSAIYENRYGMKPYEWRTLAILGPSNEFTALEIVALSSMDKVSVSRAISAMNERGWLVMRTNKLDARSRVLKLSKAGRSAYADLVPRMLELEHQMLSVLTPDEEQELRRLMKKLTLGNQG